MTAPRDVLAGRIESWIETTDVPYDYADRLITDLYQAGFEIVAAGVQADLDRERTQREFIDEALLNAVVERDRLSKENARLDALHAEQRIRRIVAETSCEGLTGQVKEMTHALDHVVACPTACADCRKVARSALDHENFADFMDESDK